MADGMSYGMACLMVAGVLFTLMGALLMLLVVVRARGERRRAGALHGRAESAVVRSQASAARAHAAVLRAQAARDRAVARDGRRTRKGAPWSSTGMNVLLLLLLMAPYADRLTLGV